LAADRQLVNVEAELPHNSDLLDTSLGSPYRRKTNIHNSPTAHHAGILQCHLLTNSQLLRGAFTMKMFYSRYLFSVQYDTSVPEEGS